jgi:hypothetical protein
MTNKKKIGFKFTWEHQAETDTQPIHELINNQPTTPPAFTQLASKLDTLKDFMTKTAFAKMKKADRVNIVEQYDFYLSLFNEYTLKTIN